MKCKERRVRSNATQGCCCKPANRFRTSPAQPPLRPYASESLRCGKRQRESVLKVNKVSGPRLIADFKRGDSAAWRQRG